MRLRKFKTKNFTVTVSAFNEPFDVANSHMEPEQCKDVLESLENGETECFYVQVVVSHVNQGELCSDYLSQCVYAFKGDFMDHKECGKENRKRIAQGDTARCGSYFHDMIKEACSNARAQLRELQSIYVR